MRSFFFHKGIFGRCSAPIDYSPYLSVMPYINTVPILFDPDSMTYYDDGEIKKVEDNISCGCIYAEGNIFKLEDIVVSLISFFKGDLLREGEEFIIRRTFDEITNSKPCFLDEDRNYFGFKNLIISYVTDCVIENDPVVRLIVMDMLVQNYSAASIENRIVNETPYFNRFEIDTDKIKEVTDWFKKQKMNKQCSQFFMGLVDRWYYMNEILYLKESIRSGRRYNFTDEEIEIHNQLRTLAVTKERYHFFDTVYKTLSFMTEIKL